MRQLIFILTVLVISLFSEHIYSKNRYFNQIPPGNTAMLFAPGIISTGMHDDCGPIYTKKYSKIFYRIAQAPHSIIVFRKKKKDIWSEPEIVSFSGRYSDGVPALTYDEKRIYFASNRPDNQKGKNKNNEDIWYVDKTSGGWGIPKLLNENVNSKLGEFGASVARNGNLYFTSTNKDKTLNIFRSELVNNIHQKRQNLGEVINSYDAACPCIAPDESFIIFTSTKRPDVIGRADLYISFSNTSGEWTKPVNLGNKINLKSFDYFPSLSPDGKYLFFVSDRAREWSYSPKKRTYSEMKNIYGGPGNGRNDIYWVSTEIIKKLK